MCRSVWTPNSQRLTLPFSWRGRPIAAEMPGPAATYSAPPGRRSGRSTNDISSPVSNPHALTSPPPVNLSSSFRKIQRVAGRIGSATGPSENAAWPRQTESRSSIRPCCGNSFSRGWAAASVPPAQLKSRGGRRNPRADRGRCAPRRNTGCRGGRNKNPTPPRSEASRNSRSA